MYGSQQIPSYSGYQSANAIQNLDSQSLAGRPVPGMTMSGYGHMDGKNAGMSRFLTPSIQGPYTQDPTKDQSNDAPNLQVTAFAETMNSNGLQIVSVVDKLFKLIENLNAKHAKLKNGVNFLLGSVNTSTLFTSYTQSATADVDLVTVEEPKGYYQSTMNFELTDSTLAALGSGPKRMSLGTYGPVGQSDQKSIPFFSKFTATAVAKDTSIRDVDPNGFIAYPYTNCTGRVPAVGTRTSIYLVASLSPLTPEVWSFDDFTLPNSAGSFIYVNPVGNRTDILGTRFAIAIPTNVGLVTSKCTYTNLAASANYGWGYLSFKAKNKLLTGGEAVIDVLPQVTLNLKNGTNSNIYVSYCFFQSQPWNVTTSLPTSFSTGAGSLSGTARLVDNTAFVDGSLPGTVQPACQWDSAASPLGTLDNSSDFFRLYNRISKFGFNAIDIIKEGSSVVAGVAAVLTLFPPTAELAIPATEFSALIARNAVVAQSALSEVDKYVRSLEAAGLFAGINIKDVKTLASGSVVASVGMPLLFNLAPLLIGGKFLSDSKAFAKLFSR